MSLFCTSFISCVKESVCKGYWLYPFKSRLQSFLLVFLGIPSAHYAYCFCEEKIQRALLDINILSRRNALVTHKETSNWRWLEVHLSAVTAVYKAPPLKSPEKGGASPGHAPSCTETRWSSDWCPFFKVLYSHGKECGTTMEAWSQCFEGFSVAPAK